MDDTMKKDSRKFKKEIKGLKTAKR